MRNDSKRHGTTTLLRAALLAALIVLPSMAGAAAERLDLNTASAEQLVELPGIGPAKAAAIVEERSKAPFASVDDLDRVKGIGPAMIADLREQVAVSSSSGE